MKKLKFITPLCILVFGCNLEQTKNSAPVIEIAPLGPVTGLVNVVYKFKVYAIDPDGDRVSIRFSWGDGNVSEWSPLVNSGDLVESQHSWAREGTYEIKAQARDEHGNIGQWSVALRITITLNSGPVVTSIFGQSVAFVGTEYEYVATAMDPLGDSVCVRFSWGDGTLSTWTSFLPSGSTFKAKYGWTNRGVYVVKAQAKNKKGHEGIWSDSIFVTVFSQGDVSPVVAAIQGPSSCVAGSVVSFQVQAVDPNGDSVSVRFSWGDGDTSSWSGFYASGSWIPMSHRWSTPGEYRIRAQARDKAGNVSAWSTEFVIVVLSAEGSTRWVQRFGGQQWDQIFSLTESHSSGIMFAGASESDNAIYSDVWVGCVSGNGTLIWDRRYQMSGDQVAYCISRTSDNGYILAGSSSPYSSGTLGALLIKIDNNGNLLWAKELNFSGECILFSVAEISGGRFVACGTRGGNAIVFLFDGAGNLLNSAELGKGALYSVKLDSYGDIICAGVLESGGIPRMVLCKFNTSLQGSVIFKSTGNYGEYAYDFVEVPQTGYILVGSSGDPSDIWNGSAKVCHVNYVGDLIWTKTIPGSCAFGIAKSSNSGFGVCGYSLNQENSNSMILCKISNDGSVIFASEYGVEGSNIAYDIIHSNSLYILGGYTESFGSASGDGIMIAVQDSQKGHTITSKVSGMSTKGFKERFLYEYPRVRDYFSRR